MKVYIATYSYDYDSTTLVGAFSSKELAQEYLNKNYKGWGDEQRIEEWELDIGG